MTIRYIDFIEARAKDANISSKSHLVSVFGDVISQHGGWIWLGSLIEALAPLGFSERLIRTSVFRLVKDNWLKAEKEGRKSFYSFTSIANKHYEKAARRIYAGELTHSDDGWLIVIPAFVEDEQLQSFKRQLSWLGFSSLASGVYAHPSIDQQSLEETIEEMALQEKVIIFNSDTRDQFSATALKQLVHERWNIKQLEQDYNALVETYAPLVETIETQAQPTPQQAFLLRTLLIHEYRRVLLKDHELPKQMLPENWVGFQAHQLVRHLYDLLAKQSSQYIRDTLRNADGTLPTEDDAFWARFKR